VISTVEKILFLKSVALFGNIPSEDLSHVARITEEIDVSPTQSIVSEGEAGDSMYLLINGEVKVHVGNHQITTLGSQQFFGEMAILDSEPRSASVTALTQVTALRIQQNDFSEILSEKPEIAQGIIKVLTRRLRDANRESLSKASVAPDSASNHKVAS